MALDINKIIRESINETVIDPETDDPDKKTDNKTDEVVIETETNQVADTGAAETATDDVAGDANKMCVASAISAGLGAMTLRNHLRTIK
jgi:hypothetical protein